METKERLPVRIWGDPILKEVTEKITDFNEDLVSTVDQMIDTMIYFDGIGIAANQVGFLERICIYDTEKLKKQKERVIIKPNHENCFVMINPEIVEQRGKQRAKEGCLSFPDLFLFIDRPEEIDIKFQDLSGEEHTMTTSGFFAGAACHEIDHLDGILFIERASRNMLSFSKKKLQRIKELYYMLKQAEKSDDYMVEVDLDKADL